MPESEPALIVKEFPYVGHNYCPKRATAEKASCHSTKDSKDDV